jgi:23S rRNA (uracil1939-C5)-methyltransferase
MPQVEITGIAAGGAGVGRLPDGRAVFVHRTAPGELVDIELLEERGRWARGELLAVRRESPDRRIAPCPHYDRCGGCTLEHLEYPVQLRAKRELVVEALRRIGGLELPQEFEIPSVTPSPHEFRYRNRVSFTLFRLGGSRVVAGFHQVNRPGRVVDITGACLLPEPAIAEAWARLREGWGPGAHRLPSGRRLRLTVRGSSAGEVALIVNGGYGPGRPEELLEHVPELAAIWHEPARRGPRQGSRGGSGVEDLQAATMAGKPTLLAGTELVAESWADEEVGVSGAVFLQVNRGAAALLEAHVLELAGQVSGERVVDAYCGVGVIARKLARAGAEVVGIELDAAAVAEARRLAPPGAEFVAARVEDALPAALPAGLVILNPPRTGLDPAVPETLRLHPPRRIIYVSCDPATLARDLARLGPGFRVRSLRSFDLFPQTAHVETVVELVCDTL